MILSNINIFSFNSHQYQAGETTPEPDYSLNALLSYCLPQLARNAPDVIAKCKGYVRPEMNISALATPPPDGYFKIKDRNFRRIGRSVSRCSRAFVVLSWDRMLDTKMTFCLSTLSHFMQDVLSKCAPLSKPITVSALPCFSRIIDRSNQLKNGDYCKSVGQRFPVSNERVKRRVQLTKLSKKSCYYGFNDVFSEPVFRCLNGGVGIAQHVIDNCLVWLSPGLNVNSTKRLLG